MPLSSRDTTRFSVRLLPQAQLKRLKWFLWHGNVFRARGVIEDLKMDLDVEGAGQAQAAKGHKAVVQFSGYIRANTSSIPNYGKRYRAGEPISNAFVESAVNEVVSKWMVKKQQMRWTPRGAHLLLQMGTRVLNDELDEVFCRWYPEFVAAPQRGGGGSVTSRGFFRSPRNGQSLGRDKRLIGTIFVGSGIDTYSGQSHARCRSIQDTRMGRGSVTAFSTFDPFPSGSLQHCYQLIKIIEGWHDDYIEAWATDVGNLAYPVFVRFAHEMNRDWYPWAEAANHNSPGEYVRKGGAPSDHRMMQTFRRRASRRH